MLGFLDLWRVGLKHTPWKVEWPSVWVSKVEDGESVRFSIERVDLSYMNLCTKSKKVEDGSLSVAPRGETTWTEAVRALIVEGPFGLTLRYYENLTKLCRLFKDLEKAPAFFELQRSIKGLQVIGK